MVMRPATKVENNYLQRKYDLEKFQKPELRWNYYDAYFASPAATLAINNEENSIDKLNKYLKLTIPKPFQKEKLIIPAPFHLLVPLQQEDGRWEDVGRVKDILGIPHNIGLRNVEPWQEATAFVLAAIRKFPHYFNYLIETHDLAIDLIDKNLIYRAGYIISCEGNIQDTGKLTQIADRIEVPSLPQIRTNSLTLNTQLGSASTNAPLSPLASTREFTKLRSLITYSTNEDLLNSLRDEVESYRLRIIDWATLIEKRIVEIKECLAESARIYRLAETYAARNTAFEKLTYMLGDGYKAVVGPLDWKRFGVAGYRPVLISCLNDMYKLAQLRLRLDEEEHPECNPNLNVKIVRKTSSLIVKCRYCGRWAFMWNGQDLVYKILHSLDFLRDSVELSQWFGRSYYFTANPLSLPVVITDEIVGADQLNMMEKLEDELRSEPFYRTSPIDLCEDAKYKIFIKDWSAKYTDIAEKRRAFNWPIFPDIVREESVRREFYTAILVLYVNYISDITTTISNERSLLAFRDTAAGATKSKMQPKVVKKLTLPFDKTFDVNDIIKKGIATRSGHKKKTK